ncbi:MAG: O-antigen ligase family protein [Candidatus Zixiibacteriota bacterium]
MAPDVRKSAPDRLRSDSEVYQSGLKITWKHLSIAGLAIISVVSALAMLRMPDKFQLALIFAVPGLFFLIVVLLNPFIGVYIYLLFEYLRPYDLVPALLPLKIPMLVIGITTVSWLIRVSKTGGFEMHKFTWVYLSFVALIGFTVVTADNYYIALLGFREMCLFFIMYLIALDNVNSFSRYNKLVWLMLLIHFFFASKGVYNYLLAQDVTGGQRTSGAVGTSFLADENDFALALNVMIPFAFFALTYARKFITKLFSFAVLMTLMFGVVSSFSRGGWLGLVAAVGYCLLRSKRKAVTISFAVVLLIALVIVAPPEYWSEVSTISDTHESTAASRLNYWEAAVRMYLDYPIIGVGAGNGGSHLVDYVTGFKDPATQWGRAFHGTVPQVLAELGTVGICLYLAMLIMAFRHLLRIRRDAIRSEDGTRTIQFVDSVLGGIIAYIVTATFLSTAYYPQLWTLFMFAMVLLKIDAADRQQAAARTELEANIATQDSQTTV